MDLSKINRALGYIEGLATGIQEPIRSLLLQSAEDIEEAMGLACGEQSDWKRKFEVDHPSMDELTDALWQHHEDFGQGRMQNFSEVCRDCKAAADLITDLRQEIERLLFDRYAEG